MNVIKYISTVLCGIFVSTTALAATPRTIGWIEHVGIQSQNLIMKAKIDTGADNSSVHAENIQVVKKDGIHTVKFTLRNKQGDSMSMEKPLVRYALIKRKGAEPLRRPVVEMDLCVGNSTKTVPVNLANRENFAYRMLVGRSYLKNGYVVDANSKYTTEPACGDKPMASRS